MTAKVAKPIKMAAYRAKYDRISFFGMPIITLGLLGKFRVGRVTGNTFYFFCGGGGANYK